MAGVGKSNTTETAFLSLLFTNVAWTNVGDAGGLRATVTPGSLYVSLHTADPDEAGVQTTSEATYTNYARVAVARSAAGWTVSGAQVTNAAAVTFPQCGATPNTITHVGVGTQDGPSAGELLYMGALTSPLAVSNGVTPSFAIGQLIASET